MELGFTRHAERRMRLYRVSREDAAALTSQPDVTRPDPVAPRQQAWRLLDGRWMITEVAESS
jgi:hypothetical protein